MTIMGGERNLRQIVDLLSINVENEILPQLGRIETRLLEHTTILQEHTSILREHTSILQEHTDILHLLQGAIIALSDDMKLVKARLDIT